MPQLSLPTHAVSALSGLAIIGFIGVGWSFAQESDKELEAKVFKTIEGRFFQVQDESGYFWQTAENGALTSGETQYLQSGLNLLVNKTAFAPTEGELVSPTKISREAEAISLGLREERESLRIQRSLAFDLPRGGVRVLDSFTNTGKTEILIEVDLRTTYPFAWQSLHDQSGDVLSRDPGLQMGESDRGILIHFSPVEGRHDTFILSASGEQGLQPRLAASGNRRELTLSYEIKVPPTKTISLLHWILQAGLQEVTDVEKLEESVFRNGRLVKPGLEREDATSVANFSKEAFPAPQQSFGELRQLLSLNTALQEIGAQRRSSEVLWLDSTNQLSGTVSGGKALEMEEIYRGPQSIPLSDIAAIVDPKAGRDELRVFLRDGRVMVGQIDDLGLSFLTDGSETPLALETGGFVALLFPVEKRDGSPQPETVGFLELIDGVAFSIDGKSELEFELTSLAGNATLPASEISEMKYLSGPIPHYRWVTKTGDRFSGFLTGGTLQLKVEGEIPIEIPLPFVSRFGMSGLKEQTISEGETSWIDFDEVPAKWIPDQGFLFEMGGLKSGSFAEKTLVWRQGEKTIKIATDQIRSLKRDLSQSGHLFSVTLQSGETLVGKPDLRLLNVTLDDKIRSIPLEKIHAYRSSSS